MDDGSTIRFLGAGIAMVGALGAGIGLGAVFYAWLGAIARNPSADAKLKQVGLIGFAATELVLLMSFTVAALLIFAV